MTLEGCFPNNWYKIYNHVVNDNAITELHYRKGVESYANSQLY